MDLSVVFNELSLRNPATNREQARDWMDAFIETLKATNDAGLQTLRTHTDFRALLLAPDYPLLPCSR